MNGRSLATGVLLGAVLPLLNFAHAEEVLIKCNDEKHCDRSYYSAREWVKDHGFLEREREQAAADAVFDTFLFGNAQQRLIPQESLKFVTAKSTVDGNVMTNVGPYPKSLMLEYRISFQDRETIKVFANCANIFRCMSPAREELAKLVAFVEGNDSVVEKMIVAKQEQRKKEEEAKIRIAEEREAKRKQSLQDQIARRKASQADIKKVGAMVCYYDLGTTEKVGDKPRFTGGGLQIKGFTENFQNQKIQVRVSSITSNFSQVNDAPRFNATKGGILWTTPSDWEACLEN